jgi:hypothetical protein
MFFMIFHCKSISLNETDHVRKLFIKRLTFNYSLYIRQNPASETGRMLNGFLHHLKHLKASEDITGLNTALSAPHSALSVVRSPLRVKPKKLSLTT